MSVLTFKEIASHGPYRSHLSEVGSVYVPKAMGGVSVNLIEDDTQLTIELHPIQEKWKRYTYIGISVARLLFERLTANTPGISTIPLFFEYDKEKNCWFTVIQK